MARGLASSLLADIAQEIGLDLVVEPRYGYAAQLNIPDGRRSYIRGTVFDINSAGATDVAKDKDQTAFFLRRLGYPVPQGAAFFTPEWCATIRSTRGPSAAWRYGQRLGMPVIVKPNSTSKGAGVWLAYNREEFFCAIAEASRLDRVYLVQRHVSGEDFRIVVLDGEVISAYRRLQLSVSGNGKATVRDLLRETQSRFKKAGRDTHIRPKDPRIAATLRRHQLTLDSVLGADRSLTLLPAANLSMGGEAVDVTEEIHPDWQALAAAISRDMNLRFAGIDVLTTSSLVKRPDHYVVLEVNAAPGLDNYAAVGEVQRRRVRDLYERLLLSLVE